MRLILPINIEVPPPTRPIVPDLALSAQVSQTREISSTSPPHQARPQDKVRGLIIAFLSLIAVHLVAALMLLSIFIVGSQDTPTEPDEPAVL